MAQWAVCRSTGTQWLGGGGASTFRRLEAGFERVSRKTRDFSGACTTIVLCTHGVVAVARATPCWSNARVFFVVSAASGVICPSDPVMLRHVEAGGFGVIWSGLERRRLLRRKGGPGEKEENKNEPNETNENDENDDDNFKKRMTKNTKREPKGGRWTAKGRPREAKWRPRETIGRPTKAR